MKKIHLYLWALLFSIGCVVAQEKKFTILHTSDEHSTLLPIPLTDYSKDQPNPTLGGFARLATKVAQIKAAKGEEPVILLSAGDIMGGSPFAWLILKNKSFEISIMQKIGYSAMAIGNHEFDYGPDILASYFERAGYTGKDNAMSIICSNLNIPDKNTLNNINIEHSRIYTLSNGIKLGVFGILGEGAYKLAPAAGDVEIFDQYEVGNKMAAELREKGADVVVLLSHSGIAEDRLMAKKIEGVDVILGGHDHISTPEPEIVNGTIIVHPSYYLQYVGQLELAFDPATKKVRLANKDTGTSYLQPLDASVPEDTTIARIIDECTNELNFFIQDYTKGQFKDIRETVIKSDFAVKKEQDFVETTIGNFVADAMRLEGSKITGQRVDFAIQGNGVIRGDVIPGIKEWSKGNFALFDLLTLSGLGSGPDKSPGYPMVSAYLTEKEIFNVLEVTAMLSQVYGDIFFLQVSGLKYTYDPGKSMWLKIPYLNTPVPATMAVKDVQLYVGDGIQKDNGEYIQLDRNGDRLFHVVTDYYLAAFLPMVGEVLPKLEITFKDKNRKVRTLDECVVHHDGKEFKIWESVAMYAQRMGQMDELYKAPQGRITTEKGIPLVVWTITALVLLILAILFGIRKLIRWRKSRKR